MGATSPIRDVKDLFLLSMAESVPVDYIVSGDKDLLSIRQFQDVKIITVSEFLGCFQSEIGGSGHG